MILYYRLDSVHKCYGSIDSIRIDYHYTKTFKFQFIFECYVLMSICFELNMQLLLLFFQLNYNFPSN